MWFQEKPFLYRSAMYSLYCIIHNCIECNVPLYINFIDFKAAFDSINRDFIWKAYEHYGLPTKYIKVFKAFFRETENAVRVNGELTRWFDVDPRGLDKVMCKGLSFSTLYLTGD